MNLLKPYVIFLLWVITLLIFTTYYLRWNGEYSGSYVHTNLTPPESRDLIPAGEIVTGFHLKQPVNWPSLDNITKQDASSSVCVDLQLANYGDRHNEGTIALTLQANGVSRRVTVDASAIRDNAFHQFCFNDLIFGSIAHEPTNLILEGVNGKPGSSITAWLTADSVYGKAQINGVDSNKSLLFRINTVRKKDDQRISAIILTILCGLSGLLLFWPVFRQPATK
ncbi:hypothetical protein [Glaciimonas soli]|uniref:Uncharacterized protein n=1 Tax=Glaciimonas soli TaxID=2590999 RepID=A0A843YXM7_9BURK|nr:hypothetical protein [Glaciimonas soli]MQR01306.1 hypothetical protein [Glaciimonas soli]